MRSRVNQGLLRAVFAVIAACFVVTLARAQNPAYVFTGTVEKVDAAAKTIAVKTADGTVETVKFTEDTTVHGLADAAKAADLVGKEGGHVVVHATREGAVTTAHSVDWFGEKTMYAAEDAKEDAGNGSKSVAAKTVDGTKGAVVAAGHATANTGKAVGHYTVVGAEKGGQATVHYTAAAGKKIVGIFKHP